jgi:hypothetical protein
LAEEGLRVTGVDASPTIILLCRERLPDHNRIVTDIAAWRFDGILAWDSFFHLNNNDQRRMLLSSPTTPPRMRG